MQDEITGDTEKLFQLSTDLKEYVDKNQGILSWTRSKKLNKLRSWHVA